MSVFVTRDEAGLRPPAGTYSRIAPTGITAHYAGPSPWGMAGIGTHDRCASIWRAFQAYHMDHHRWADIAYTSGVCPHGSRYEGRPAWARTAANGTNEGNTRSAAVCYIAGAGDPLTDDAKVAYHAEAARLTMPLRWVHSEWLATECPGDPLTRWKTAGWPEPIVVIPPPLPPVVTPFPEDAMQRVDTSFDSLDDQGGGFLGFDGTNAANIVSVVFNGSDARLPAPPKWSRYQQGTTAIVRLYDGEVNGPGWDVSVWVADG